MEAQSSDLVASGDGCKSCSPSSAQGFLRAHEPGVADGGHVGIRSFAQRIGLRHSGAWHCRHSCLRRSGGGESTAPRPPGDRAMQGRALTCADVSKSLASREVRQVLGNPASNFLRL